MQEFISFNYSNDFKFFQELTNPSRRDAAKLLYDIACVCREKMFSYAPIDEKAVIELAGKKSIKSLHDFVKEVSETKPSALEKELRKFVFVEGKQGEGLPEKKRGDPIDFAPSCYLYGLYSKVFPFTVSQSSVEISGEVKFAANYAGWQAVRKASIVRAEKKEVLACLVSVYNSCARKACEFACIDFNSFNSWVQGFLKKFPERKSFSKLSLMLSQAINEGLEQKIQEFFPKEFLSIGREAFLNEAFNYCGYGPFVSIDSINRVYPELKIPKPRGRTAGK